LWLTTTIARLYQAGAGSPEALKIDFAALICCCSHVAIQPIKARRIAVNIAKLPELLRHQSDSGTA
jgi:hypothetical protein